jgi:hypothetical protein
MKPLLAAILSLALFSCTRTVDNIRTNDSLEGTWRMVAVKDNGSGLLHSKPGAITGELEITFVAVSATTGFISGKTPINELSANYTLSESNGISIPAVFYSKVAETSWGLDFLHHIAKADTYSFGEDGKLQIHTGEKTLYFTRN